MRHIAEAPLLKLLDARVENSLEIRIMSMIFSPRSVVLVPIPHFEESIFTERERF